jgi:hypothetical protein
MSEGSKTASRHSLRAGECFTHDLRNCPIPAASTKASLVFWIMKKNFAAFVEQAAGDACALC